jgi:hypothetical protein
LSNPSPHATHQPHPNQQTCPAYPIRVLYTFHPNPARAPQLTAIPFPAPPAPETDEETRARHRETCHDLANIARHLARLAGMCAAEELTAQHAALQADPPKAPEPVPPREPPAQTPKLSNYPLIFARMSRVAHTFVALEKRMLANEPEPAKSKNTFRLDKDSREMPLYRAIDFAAQDQPDRVQTNREANALIFVLLYQDPEEKRPITELYDYVATSLSLKTKFSEIPNEILHPNKKPQPAPEDPAGPKDWYLPKKTNPPIPPF